MEAISAYAPVLLDAQIDCQNHRREMCEIVTGDGSGQEICTRLRDSILRYRARVPKEGPEVKEFLTDKDSMLKFFSFIKVQSELFKKHDHLVDEIAGDLKNETLTFKERLESIRNHLM